MGRSTKSWLNDNKTEMYSTHNEGNSSETFIRILKKNIYKHMIAVSKNDYINKLDKIVDKYGLY